MKCEIQKLSIYDISKMYLHFTHTLTDNLHAFIEKCKSRITIHVKVKTLKRKQYHINNSYTFRKERTPTIIYL
jgi:hypothetical protein